MNRCLNCQEELIHECHSSRYNGDTFCNIRCEEEWKNEPVEEVEYDDLILV